MSAAVGLFVLWALVCTTPAWGAPALVPETAFFQQHCLGCHGEQKQSAGINLTKLLADQPLVRHTSTWRRVMEAVETGAMPTGR